MTTVVHDIELAFKQIVFTIRQAMILGFRVVECIAKSLNRPKLIIITLKLLIEDLGFC